MSSHRGSGGGTGDSGAGAVGGALPLKDCFPQLEAALSQYEALVAGVREVRPGHTNPRDMEQVRW